MTKNGKLKVLYLAGSGRSGSTLLDIILGQVPGFCPVGEVRDVWDYGFRDNRPCGCGEPVRACPTWSKVIAQLGANLDPQQMVDWREKFCRTKRLAPIFLKGSGYLKNEEIREYMAKTEDMYHALAKETNSHIIVDSSKWPTYAYLLSQIESIDFYVLHLVRDPRACAYSWQRKKEIEPGQFLEIQSPFFTTSFWSVWNPAIRKLFAKNPDRYMFMRYEDFVKAPRTEVSNILRYVGTDPAENPFTDENTVPVHPTHAIEGNVARFHAGDIQIRADSEWRDKISWGTKATVSAMAWPWLIQYGYWLNRAEN